MAKSSRKHGVFNFAAAGHKTTANTLVHALILLAYRPTFQKALQAELDNVLGSRPQSDWSYKTDFPKLLDGYTGAILNETLRVYPVIPFIPRTTESPKSLKIGDQTYMVPAHTICMIHASGSHNNPKFWPQIDTSTSENNPIYPIPTFDPGNWLKSDTENGSERNIITPEPGSYLPFGDGYRTCMGKRFAHIEFCAVMAAIFKEWSVELEVKGEDTTEGYAAARRNAEQQMSKEFYVSVALKMINDVPLRLVRRGEEKWFD